jgi:GT2 family glycosyltransferase
MLQTAPAAAASNGTAGAAWTPLVSILVPCFNGAAWLREALDSILAQTYPHIEVLLLDDCSSDDTPRIAAEYADRVRVIRQPRNLGIYDNVNVGIDLARGELIATYHADDIYLPGIVQAQVDCLRAHPEVGAVFCADIFVDAQGREYGRMVLPPPVRGGGPLSYATVLNALLDYKNRFLVCPTAMVRASVHEAVGRYRQDRYRNTADLEMWLRIARHSPIAIVEAHLMKYRHFHGNSSQRYHKLRTAPENYFVILDEYLGQGDRRLARADALANYEAHRAEDRLMAAISHYIKGELADGRRALKDVRLAVLWNGRTVQRWRLMVLTLGMAVLLRLPRIDAMAQRMLHRWHMKGPPRRSATG